MMIRDIYCSMVLHPQVCSCRSLDSMSAIPPWENNDFLTTDVEAESQVQGLSLSGPIYRSHVFGASFATKVAFFVAGTAHFLLATCCHTVPAEGLTHDAV